MDVRDDFEFLESGWKVTPFMVSGAEWLWLWESVLTAMLVPGSACPLPGLWPQDSAYTCTLVGAASLGETGVGGKFLPGKAATVLGPVERACNGRQGACLIPPGLGALGAKRIKGRSHRDRCWLEDSRPSLCRGWPQFSPIPPSLTAFVPSILCYLGSPC